MPSSIANLDIEDVELDSDPIKSRCMVQREELVIYIEGFNSCYTDVVYSKSRFSLGL